jgi:Zn-finger nucleic acid-binding protein
MVCSGCGAAMTALTLQDRMGADLAIDVCPACHAFWFDRYENIRLSASATLKLFDVMAQYDTASRPLSQPMKCPRCGAHLLQTHDMQLRGTTFEYWRCPHEHGHFITFLQFLKEKDFVRPMTPQQIAELRQNVQTLNCSNCGGPIDLAKQTVCPHCGSPLTMLDLKQIAAHVRELQQADEAHNAPDSVADREVARRFTAALGTLMEEARPQPVLQTGLRQIVDWLTK